MGMVSPEVVNLDAYANKKEVTETVVTEAAATEAAATEAAPETVATDSGDKSEDDG